MKQNDIEQAETTAHTAEAELKTGAAVAEVSLGKFKDVKSLLTAYESLESEFTRRSSRLKELEGIVALNSEKTTPTGAFSEKRADERGNCLNAPSEKDGALKGGAVKGEAGAESLTEQLKARLLSLEERFEAAEKARSAIEANGDKQAVTEPKRTDAENGETNERRGISAEEIVKEYLLQVSRGAARVPRGGGAAVVAPPRKPKNFAEAGRLAAADIKNRGG